MKNVTRIKTQLLGRESWRLLDPEGEPISAFDRYMKLINDYAYASKKRYSEVVSNHVDYLYEVNVLGNVSVTRKEANDALDYYLVLLRDGPNVDFSQTRKGVKTYDEGDFELEMRLRKVAITLGITAIDHGSWSNTLAALNKFLYLSTELEIEMKEIAILKGKINSDIVEQSFIDHRNLFSEITQSKFLSAYEVKQIKQNSMLGSVMRIRNRTMTRPAGIKSISRKAKQNGNIFDFPMDQLPKLLQAATCWRDRALWLLTAASGIRRSEALNVEWDHISFGNRTVHVLDPLLLRYGRDLPANEKANRFKGRDASWTYLIQPYKDLFFEALMMYRKFEYILPQDRNDFVFQYIHNPYRGKPLREASDVSLNKSFTNAVVRAGISGPPLNTSYVWTQHSFRHAYGVFMLNDIEIEGQATPGLTEAEVQLLMGHKSVLSTRKYARPRLHNLKRKLEVYEQKTFGELADISMILEK